MNFFASEDTTKVKLKSGIELEVRADVSKRLFNRLIAALPQTMDQEKGLTISQAGDFTQGLFSAFVVGWSLDREATVENYLDLKREYTDEIDEFLGNHFSAVSVPEKEAKKGQGTR
jgi:hypothetical protein